jgi:hypothetical protein
MLQKEKKTIRLKKKSKKAKKAKKAKLRNKK